MGAFTNKMEEWITEHFLRTSTTVPQPAGLWLTLFTADPTEAGLYTNECGYTGYTREVIAFNTINSTTGVITNNGAVTFDANQDAGAVTVTHAGVTTSATLGAGDLLIYGELQADKILAQGDTLSFADGALSLTLD